jgi:hypothetical protein
MALPFSLMEIALGHIKKHTWICSQELIIWRECRSVGGNGKRQRKLLCRNDRNAEQPSSRQRSSRSGLLLASNIRPTNKAREKA